MRVLIVGCGDTGARLARTVGARGWEVTGLVRSAAGRARVLATGAEPLVADLDQPLPPLPPADLLFYCAPPPRSGDDDPRLERVLAQFPPHAVTRLVYISTSGVYGDCGGAWVNEDRAVNPQTDRARRRAAAEARLRAWGGPAVILRAPGIYGPGRIPIDRVRNGDPVLADSDSPWTNRIHVEDLATCALAAAENGPTSAVYNAADGNPTPMGTLYRALAACLGLPPPPTIDRATAEREWSATRLSFLRESRRLDNRRLREVLGVRLRYPDLEAGLEGSL